MIKKLLKEAISAKYPGVDFDILTPPNPEMGDYSVNLAFNMAKAKKEDPKTLAHDLAGDIAQIDEVKELFSKVKDDGAFINFYLSEDFLRKELLKILDKGDDYGSDDKKNININLEFVSANPTGPLTVHNIRAAPYGDTLVGILKKAGFQVTKEYYINDSGNQIRLLGESVAKRYLRIKGKAIDFEDNLYQGEYIVDIAKEIDEAGLADKIENFEELSVICRDYAVKKLLDSIKKSLTSLGVEYDVWFSEKSLHSKGEIEGALKILENGNHVYEKEGAKWLKMDPVRSKTPSEGSSADHAQEAGRTSNGTGENDAVLVKSDGSFSYLMADIAYTRNKFIRGFDKAINIWGTDHHGDVARLKTGVKSLTYDEDKLQILLHQLVQIKKKDEVQRMSKRKGEFVLLDELLGDVGKDAIRFFFLMKDLNTHMEFDVELAKEQSKKNPVYYIQYANARLNSIFSKVKVMDLDGDIKENELLSLKEAEEIMLIRKMAKFPELIEDISESYQVHHLAQYSYELASCFHNFYEKHQVVQDNKELEKARLILCRAVALVLGVTLNLMGISAPKKM